MKLKKILTGICALLLALFPACAGATEDVQSVIGGILAYKAGEAGVEDWVKTTLPNQLKSEIGILPGLYQMDDALDFSACAEEIRLLLENAGDADSPVTLQRYALSLIACGRRDLLPEGIADQTIDQLGIMSDISGLNLLRNGVPSDLWSIDRLTELILSKQLADGGWAVRGDNSDVDVTAMCIQALYPVSEGRESVRDAVERALALLSERQQPSGGFSSYGTENAESTAQLLIALSVCEIDPYTDERFLKNGVSAVDALLTYRLPSGAFSHTPGGDANDMATRQAFCALVAVENAPVDLYDYTAAISHAGTPEASSAGVRSAETTGHGFRFWALIGLGVLLAAASVLVLLRGRSRVRNLICIWCAGALLCAGIFCIRIESAGDYYSGTGDSSAPVTGSVYLSIRCDTVAGRADDESTPESGEILPRTRFDLHEGESVYDLLMDAARTYGIQVEHDGSLQGMSYIPGINYLYEFQYGDLSGWMYMRNGEFPSVGCGSCLLSDGDEIVWAYTTNMGEDLK